MTLSKIGPVERSDKGIWCVGGVGSLRGRVSKRQTGSKARLSGFKWSRSGKPLKVQEYRITQTRMSKVLHKLVLIHREVDQLAAGEPLRSASRTLFCYQHDLSDTGWVLQNSAWSWRLRPNASCALSVQMSVKDCSVPKLAFSPNSGRLFWPRSFTIRQNKDGRFCTNKHSHEGEFNWHYCSYLQVLFEIVRPRLHRKTALTPSTRARREKLRR